MVSKTTLNVGMMSNFQLQNKQAIALNCSDYSFCPYLIGFDFFLYFNSELRFILNYMIPKNNKKKYKIHRMHHFL